MKKIPIALWFVSGGTVATLIIGLVTNNYKNLSLIGGAGVIITASAFGKFLYKPGDIKDTDHWL